MAREGDLLSVRVNVLYLNENLPMFLDHKLALFSLSPIQPRGGLLTMQSV